MDETELPTIEAPNKPSAVQQGLDQLKRMATGTVTLIAEVVIVVYVGMTIGAYMSNKTIVSDCASVSMAKVGEHYVNCTVVVPKKDGEATPPR